MFFCHFAKSICSNVNIAIVGPGAAKRKKKKEREILLLFTLNFIWDGSVSTSKVMLYLHERNWGQNLSQELHYARCQAPASLSRWELQELGTSLDFSQIHFKVTFYSKEQRNFVTISTKITSVNEYQSIFQFSEVALVSGTSALTAELMP